MRADRFRMGLPAYMKKNAVWVGARISWSYRKLKNCICYIDAPAGRSNPLWAGCWMNRAGKRGSGAGRGQGAGRGGEADRGHSGRGVTTKGGLEEELEERRLSNWAWGGEEQMMDGKMDTVVWGEKDVIKEEMELKEEGIRGRNGGRAVVWRDKEIEKWSWTRGGEGEAGCFVFKEIPPPLFFKTRYKIIFTSGHYFDDFWSVNAMQSFLKGTYYAKLTFSLLLYVYLRIRSASPPLKRKFRQLSQCFVICRVKKWVCKRAVWISTRLVTSQGGWFEYSRPRTWYLRPY